MRGAARIALPMLALAGGCAAGVLPALAADQTVFARDASFTPGTVALKPGETLTIRHDDGSLAHELKFDDEPNNRQNAGTGWTVTRTFGAGEAREQPYGFSCSLHYLMSGRVYVNAGGTVPGPTPTATATATATASPTPPPPGGGTPNPGDPTPPPPAAALRSLAVTSGVVCARRGPRCRRPGVALRIDLSAPADVRGTLRRRAPGARRFTAFGRVRFGRVAAGPRRLTFTRTASGRRLAPGRYRLALKAAGSTRTLAFRVRAAR